MKFNLVYFDDQIQNIEAYQLMLQDAFDVNGTTDTSNYSDLLKKHKPHGILLDLHMPDENGFALYDKIIQSEDYNGCPIFFISGDVSDESRIKSIETGAIDFFDRQITEPELKLRLLSKIKMFMQGSTQVNVGNLRIDSDKFTVSIKDRPVDLTMIETRILFCVIKAMPEPIEKDELLVKIWNADNNKSKINVHLSNMKLKLWNWDHELRIKGHHIIIDPL